MVAGEDAPVMMEEGPSVQSAGHPRVSCSLAWMVLENCCGSFYFLAVSDECDERFFALEERFLN